MERVCKAVDDSVEAALKHVLPQWFKDQPESEVTYQIVFRSRLNNSFKKEDAYQVIGKAIRDLNGLAKVMFKEPALTILVEVMKSHLCLAVVKDYHKYKKFNLLQIVGIAQEQQSSKSNVDLKRKAEDDKSGDKDDVKKPKAETELDTKSELADEAQTSDPKTEVKVEADAEEENSVAVENKIDENSMKAESNEK